MSSSTRIITIDTMYTRIQEAKNRRQAADAYSMGLVFLAGNPEARADVDWVGINAYILQRWSRYGLEYIKRLAWKIAEAKE